MSTPTSASGPPTSFKTNVNRAKTKRWVEAKSYSYDGDDWGEVDDYDEYGGYDEPQTTPKPTGLRQRGQSATQTPEESFGQDIYQSSISQERPRAGSIEGSGIRQQYGLRSVTNPAPPNQSSMQSPGSFERIEDRRAFSAGGPQQIISDPSNQVYHPMQTGHNVHVQEYDPGSRHLNQPVQPQPGPLRAPMQMPTRRSMDEQSRYGGQSQSPSANSRGLQPQDQSRLSSGGSRTQSMTSNNSSLEFHSRRDFSPSAMPPPLHTRNSPSPSNDPRSRPPRKSSLSQQTQPSLPFDPQAPSMSAPIDSRIDVSQRERAGSSSSGTKALPFVRPADIYKRIEEERERERQSQDSSRPSMDAIMGRPNERPSLDVKRDSESGSRLKPKLDPVTERASDHGLESLGINEQSSGNDKPRTTSKKFDIKKSSQSSMTQNARLSSSLLLPDPSRVSGFGEDFGESFLGPDDTFGQSSHFPTLRSSENSTQGELQDGVGSTQIRDLQHQPSKGFTSAVHQAFDTAQDQVPPTPSSTADSSVGRSASGGTSAVSPIISRGPSAVDRNKDDSLPTIDDVATPTRDEENERTGTRDRSAGSFGTLKQDSLMKASEEASTEMPPPGFVPGHRRNMSTPSPDNSPLRTPELASTRHLRQPQEVDLAETTPTPTESTPSATNSFRESKALPEQKPQSIESPVPPAQPFGEQRPGSAGSGKVRGLAGKYERTSRPDSEVSSSTPRASILGASAPISDDLASHRPSNERMESFRPHLPGGWESSASIATASVPPAISHRDTRHPQLHMGLPAQESKTISPFKENQPSSLAQVKDASSNAFSAAAEAGTALAGALVAAVGLEKEEDKEAAGASNGKGPKKTGRAGSENTILHPEAARPQMLDLPDDDSLAPTPLPKDFSHQPLNGATESGYFIPPQVESSNISPTVDIPTASRQEVSLPLLSTDMHPPQYESDRLRREIAQQLSPGISSEPSTAKSDSPYQTSSRYPTHDSQLSKGGETGALPSEYDSYWNDDSDEASSTFSGEPGQIIDATTAQRQQGASVIGKSPDPAEAQPHPVMDTQHAVQPSHMNSSSPALQHRFSWEQPLADLASPSQSDKHGLPEGQREVQPPTTESVVSQIRPQEPSAHMKSEGDHQPELMREQSVLQIPHPAPEVRPGSESAVATHEHVTQELSPSTFDKTKGLPSSFGGQEVVPSLNEKQSVESWERHDSGSVPSLVQHGLAVQQTTPEADVHPAPLAVPQDQMPLPPPPPNAQPKLPAFREILALKTPSERIKAFNETQQEFANLNTGLAHWLAMMTSSLPEHRDIVLNQGRVNTTGPGHQHSPSRSKLGGIMSAGGQSSQPYYQQYLDASPQSAGPGNGASGGALGPGSSQGFSPSGGPGGKMSSQQVQAKSKEFLHTAGVFGGKANIAAKGLFSKGKNKLRDASGSKKASPLATAPITVDHASRGMLPQHATPNLPRAPSPPRVQPYSDHNRLSSDASTLPSQTSVHINAAESEQDAPSVQSVTQSQLGDDERSETSTTDSSDRPPRSSEIYGNRSQPGVPLVKTSEITTDVFHWLPAGTSPAGTPQQKQSPRSTNSSNKTPTQASFDRAAVPDLPPAPQTTESRNEALAQVESSQTVQDYSTKDAQKVSHSAPKSLYFTQSPTRMDTGVSGATEGSPPDHPGVIWDSEQSEATFHTATGEEQRAGLDLPVQSVDQSIGPTRSIEPQREPKQYLSQPSKIERSTTQSGLPSAQNANDRLSMLGPSLPFNHAHNRLQPSQDFSMGRPSMESLSSPVNPDRPSSPISPQVPTQSASQPRGRAVVPVHYGIDHDFGPESDVERARRRSPSFSRPFNPSEERRRSAELNTQQNPPVRQRTPSAEDLAMPVHLYPGSITREGALMSRQQAPEYALEGVGPPDLPPVETKTRSRRGSRSSAFFKGLTKSLTDSDSPPMPNSSGDHMNGSPATSSTNVGTKSKRSSIFRLRKSQTDMTNDGTKSKEHIVPTSDPRSRSSTVNQLPPPTVPSKPLDEDDDEFPIRPKQRSSTGFSRRLHRASTSVGKEEHQGTKKRFSVIGSLFGRANQKPQSSAEQIGQPSQQALPPGQNMNDPYYALATPLQQSPEYFSTLPTPNPPPHEGYYAPKRTKPQQYQNAHTKIPAQRPLSPFPANTPAYVQDASLRQSTSPPSTISPQKSSRSSTDFFRKVLEPGSDQAVSQSSRRESKPKGNSWTRFSTHSRNKSRQSSLVSPAIETTSTARYNGYVDPASQPRYQASPQEHSRSESPPPPPPPPKDDWHRANPRNSSLGTSVNSRSPHRTSVLPPPPAFSNHAQRQALPVLQTNVPSPHLGPTKTKMSSGEPRSSSSRPGMTPEDKRRSRQQEIETGHLSPQFTSGGGGAGISPEGKDQRNTLHGLREREEDEPIVMTATSFPGQEWRPGYDHDWLGD